MIARNICQFIEIKSLYQALTKEKMESLNFETLLTLVKGIYQCHRAKEAKGHTDPQIE